MKVAILLENFYIGGAQRVVSELVKNFDHNKAEIRVICTGRRSETQMARDVEKLVRVDYLNITGRNTLASFRKVFRALNAFKPDVVNAHLVGQLYAVPWGILHNTPTVITVHTRPEQGFVNKIEFLIRWALRFGKLSLAAVSRENQRLVQKYFDIGEEKVCCINNGVNTNSFYRVEHEYFTFINVARHDSNKNQVAILKCFAKLYQTNHNIRLILLGNGPEHQRLQQLSRELAIENAVEFPGLLNNVEGYYARSDVYVQASRREAMPMSVLEAMAAGLPVIATDVGGLTDIIKDNGFVYKVDDDAHLEALMEYIINLNPNELKQMQEASRRIVDDYTALKMAEGYYRCFLRKSIQL